jgi:hypothetical protein
MEEQVQGSREKVQGIDPAEYVRAIESDLRRRGNEFGYELPGGACVVYTAPVYQAGHCPDKNRRNILDGPVFPRRRAAASYCLQLISEQMGVPQLVLPDPPRLPKLVMQPWHLQLIVHKHPWPKTTTWRTQPHCGRYALINRNTDRPRFAATLAYRGKVWWKDLKDNPGLMEAKAKDEGYRTVEAFIAALKVLYWRIADDFFDGKRPMHEHAITEVTWL